MNLQVADLFQDDCNTYQVLGINYDNYRKPSEVAVRCIRGPYVGRSRSVQYSIIMKMFAENQLSLIDNFAESI
jgi:hypothetical protein